ncbi:MAG: DnaK suppressor protein, partial [Pseudoalteromonas distincta]
MATTVMALESSYRPSEDEEFMNERQVEYFRQKLMTWKEEIFRESRETLSHL